MRLRACVPAALALIVAAGGAAAQSSLKVEPRVGVAIPLGDLKDISEAGFAVGGSGSWFFHENIAIRADLVAELLNDRIDPFGIVPAPPLTLIHFTGGFEIDFAPPSNQGQPISFRIHGGGGATRVSGSAEYTDGSSVDFSETYLSVVGGAAIGYRVTPRIEVFADGSAYLVLFDDEDTEVFAERSLQVETFSEGWSFPVTAGVRLAF